jgi:hypothetical protein
MTVMLGGELTVSVRMSDVDVLDGGEFLGTIYDLAPEALPKAGWNWTLIHNDGSLGVHNPSFAMNVLNASIAALQAEADTEVQWAGWPAAEPMRQTAPVSKR